MATDAAKIDTSIFQARHDQLLDDFRDDVALEMEKVRIGDTVHDSGPVVKERSKANLKDAEAESDHNEKEGYGVPKYPGYEHGHDTEEGKKTEKRISKEDELRENRANMIESYTKDMEMARQKYDMELKTYAYIERQHRGMLAS
ncbi:MAG TPA: hypothetical protein VF817_03685, partial [Patescibacteria group bacterium]